MVMPTEGPGHVGNDFADELRGLGHEVGTFAYRRTNVFYKNRPTRSLYQRLIDRKLERRCARFRPEIVVVHKGGPIDAETLHRIKTRTRAIVVNVFHDNPLLMINFRNIEAYDLFFTKAPYAIRELRLAGLRNVHYLPSYCVPAHHHPVTPTPEQARALAGVVSLVGAHYPYRERFLREIAGYPVRVWGPGWTRTADPRVRALVAGDGLWGDAKLAVYCGSALSLNLHHPLNDITSVNMRTFELAAAGACQVVDFKDDLAALFKPGEEVVAFRDLPELRRQLDHYLAHPDEARAIGENARRRALAEHTVRHRVEEIMTVLEGRGGLTGRSADPRRVRR
jgi:spore maturation protein CgeB